MYGEMPIRCTKLALVSFQRISFILSLSRADVPAFPIADARRCARRTSTVVGTRRSTAAGSAGLRARRMVSRSATVHRRMLKRKSYALWRCRSSRAVVRSPAAWMSDVSETAATMEEGKCFYKRL